MQHILKLWSEQEFSKKNILEVKLKKFFSLQLLSTGFQALIFTQSSIFHAYIFIYGWNDDVYDISKNDVYLWASILVLKVLSFLLLHIKRERD